MKTSTLLTIKISKQEMYGLFESFVQHGKVTIHSDDGTCIQFVRENGEKKSPLDTIEKLKEDIDGQSPPSAL